MSAQKTMQGAEVVFWYMQTNAFAPSKKLISLAIFPPKYMHFWPFPEYRPWWLIWCHVGCWFVGCSMQAALTIERLPTSSTYEWPITMYLLSKYFCAIEAKQRCKIVLENPLQGCNVFIRQLFQMGSVPRRLDNKNLTIWIYMFLQKLFCWIHSQTEYWHTFGYMMEVLFGEWAMPRRCPISWTAT